MVGNVWVNRNVARRIASSNLKVSLYWIWKGMTLVVDDTDQPLKKVIKWKFNEDRKVDGVIIIDDKNIVWMKQEYNAVFHSGDVFTVDLRRIELSLPEGRKVVLGDVL
jgi:hypothetical protein